ncbi:secretoglobin family 1D member 2 [Phyllostomus hastatus]|uniref:secretoglobin family 1D member 2 n=1 Tax=Phyllostomus hastatus TaxID=9423 RepID=UPI001E682D26|nr:secretoglobin family 1D member 2 [Phyllostomus hastatus]
MRLSLCVLLVTLALCCYEANAEVCPAFLSEFKGFLLETENMYNIHLLMFAPPREAAEASLQVKQCVDRLPREGRQKIYNIVKKAASQCNS